MKKYLTRDSIEKRAKQTIGMRLGDIDRTGRLSTGKGGIGNMIEESWFDMKPNSRPEPDFVEAGVELKVTPVRRISKGYVSKERLVLNIINYMKEYETTFETSSFWEKNHCLQLMFYEHIDGLQKQDFKIVEAILFQFPKEDLYIIRDDWEIIVDMIRQGRAHELSESLTQYLGACTKGSTAEKSLRKQPFSKELAKQRAFSLKQSYMTYVFNTYALGSRKGNQIIRNTEVLKEVTFEEYIYSKINSHVGRTQKSFLREFDLKKSYSVNEAIVSRILGIKGKISNTEEFKKAGIAVKTIRVKYNNTIKESMSFRSFKFKELIQEEWENSQLREMLDTTRYLFVVFQFNKNNELVLKGVKFWNIPHKDLESDVKLVWEQASRTIKEGVILERKAGKVFNNLPKKKENRVAHVRPHTSKASYESNNSNADELPNGEWMTKQCFWLNNSYILEQIKDLL